MIEKIVALVKKGELSFYTCIICVVLIPLQIHWLPPFMILLGILRWFEWRYPDQPYSISDKKSRFLFLLFVILFIWQISGLFFAESLSSGLERVVKRASFVLFPAALFFPSRRISDNLNIILKVFILSIVIYILICFVRAIDRSIISENENIIFNPFHPVNTWESWFTGERLSWKIHPSYLAMYVLLSGLLSTEFFFQSQKKARFFWVILAAALVAVVLLLSSRAGIIAAAITFPLFLYYKLSASNKKHLFIASMVIFVLLFILLLGGNTRIRYTLDDFSGEKLNQTLEQDIRLNIWRSAVKVIIREPIIGVGTGNASDELKEEFLRQGYSQGFYETLNSHNQFLEILLENGIVGFLLFLILLGYAIFVAVSQRNLLLFVFLIMMVVFFMFESMLNRLAGVTFFPLFIFLLVAYKTSGFEKTLHPAAQPE